MNNWFGIDKQISKAMIAAVIVLLPGDDQHGPRPDRASTPAALELMRSYAASDTTRSSGKVRIPTALPFVFTALRVATTLATIGAIVGEYFGAPTRQPRASTSCRYSSLPQLRAVLGGDRRSRASIGIGLYVAVVVAERARHAVDASVPGRGRWQDAGATSLGRAEQRRRTAGPRRSDADRRPAVGCDGGGHELRSAAEDGAVAGPHGRRGAMRFTRRLAVLGAAVASIAAACSSGGQQRAPALTTVKLQLQWFPQAQFAGYFAAVDQGYYKDEGLDVTILPGGVDIVPATVVAGGNAEFGISWVPKMLASRESGADVQIIGQVFQRSGTLQVALKDKNITKPADWKGKKVGTWGFGNEAELYAAMRKVGIDPKKPSDVTIVPQQFDMNAFLNGDIDAAQAMIYNEYAQVLEAKNPKTGQLYKPDDLNVISMEMRGHGDAPGRDLRLAGLARRRRATRTSRSSS